MGDQPAVAVTLCMYLKSVLDEGRPSEEDAVSPGGHSVLLTGVIAQGICRVLVKLVGGPEADGRFSDISEDVAGKHLPPALILQPTLVALTQRHVHHRFFLPEHKSHAAT